MCQRTHSISGGKVYVLSGLPRTVGSFCGRLGSYATPYPKGLGIKKAVGGWVLLRGLSPCSLLGKLD